MHVLRKDYFGQLRDHFGPVHNLASLAASLATSQQSLELVVPAPCRKETSRPGAMPGRIRNEVPAHAGYWRVLVEPPLNNR